MIDRTCHSDDFEIWYERRYFGKCFRGKEVSYVKKKPLAMCIDNRTVILPTIKPCPCSIEDFNCKPNYYHEDVLCVMDPFRNFTESNKICRDGGKPLIRWNGYDNSLHRFQKLDTELCIPRSIGIDKFSKYADYCISNST
ncbi:hypothetical protein RF11_16359 [Thelohanellus kitauei]|uniref:Sortilin C-terminal domain-containing protein n=1 Tax=Thelohanellus kitauei TaxID=669202 RepID=A0A0C2J3B0_THEKT|nr:hypothetical protein RF11_16359 [Thelohanellus kitauei]